MTLRIWYIANVRFPSEKAYGPAIDNMCRAFTQMGVNVRLLVPRRIGVKSGTYPYRVSRLPILDLFALRVPGSVPFVLQTVTFLIALFGLALFASRETIIYTREPRAIVLRRLGFRVFFECHQFSAKPRFLSLANKAEGIITISKALQDKLVTAGVANPRYIVAPSGVNLDVFDIKLSKADARERLGLPASAHIAVYTGNFTTMGEDKGLSDTIRALASTRDILFVAVGGSDVDIERYAALARQEGASERVILRGHMPQAILAEYQKAADMLLMPFPDTPHYREAMSPVKMFEYMAAERPIIASDLPTIREVLSEKNAFIVPPGNPSSLAIELSKVASGSDQVISRTAAAYASVQQYSWTRRATRVLSDFLSQTKR